MVGPRTSFDALHVRALQPALLQDIDAQIGLGMVLFLAGMLARPDVLRVALVGVGARAAFHTVSHIVGSDLGEMPQTDIPTFATRGLAAVFPRRTRVPPMTA